MRKPTFEGLTLAATALAVSLIAVSDSVAGFCARAAIAVPLAWCKAISPETMQAIVTWHAF